MAIKYYEKTLNIKSQFYENEDNINLANILNNLGNVYQQQGKYNRALTYYEKSLKIQRKFYNDDNNIKLANTFNNIGNIYQ